MGSLWAGRAGTSRVGASHLIPRVVAAIVGSAGLLTVWAWLTHRLAWLRLIPSSPPMVFNTALCFVLVGVALAMSSWRKGARAIIPLAGAVTLIAIVTIVEYLFALSDGIDELFMRGYVAEKMPVPGRMALNSAIGFLLVGLAFLVRASSRHCHRYPAVAGAVGTLLTGLSVVSLFGYADELPQAYTWFRGTAMAAHTAALFLLVGVALVAQGVLEAPRDEGDFPKLLALFTTISGLVASFVLCQALVVNEREQILATLHARAAQSATLIRSRLVDMRDGLVRNAARCPIYGCRPNRSWELDSNLFLGYFPEVRRLLWMDDSFVIKDVAPDAGSERLVGRSAASSEWRRRASGLPGESRVLALSRADRILGGDEGARLIWVISMAHLGKVVGFLGAGFDPSSLMLRVLRSEKSHDRIILSEGGQEIFSWSEKGSNYLPEWQVSVPILSLDAISLSATLVPAESTIDTMETSTPWFSLAIGGALSVLLGISLRAVGAARLSGKAAQKALDSFRLQSAITENMLEGACLVRASDGAIVYVNRQLEKLFGYDAGELRGRHVSVLNAPGDLSPEDTARALMAHMERNGSWEGEIHNVRKDGSCVWCWASVSTFQHWEYGKVFVSVHADITQRKTSEDALKASLKEKEVLLREIHHRVKNNLNVVSSLLELQSYQFDDPRLKASLQESQHRVTTMALIHEKLYQSKSLARLSLRDYVSDLVLSLYHSYGKDPAAFPLELDVDGISLEMDTAIPCSLIINELVSNSLKHAFKDRTSGHLKIGIHKSATPSLGEYELEVQDDGRGIPEGFQIERSQSLGLQLVKSLAAQMGGRVEMESSHGAHVIVNFGRPTRARGQYVQ